MASDWVVILECQHWFYESRPDGLDVDPQQKRACGNPQHYPKQFAAVTLPVDAVQFADEVYTISRTDDTPLAADESYDDPTETTP